MTSYNIMMGLGGLVCTAAAIYINIQNKDGWGWFLFLAFLMFSSLKWSTKNGDQD